jgi:nicotinamidase-related amidase
MPITTIEPTAALILIDLQKGVVGAATTPVPAATVLKNAAALAAAFRRKDLPVVLVNVSGGAPGRTDTSQVAPTGERPARMHGRTDLADEIDAQPTDVRITKSRWCAFHDTPLDEQLIDFGVTQVILGGVATSISVESTARAAYDYGYHVVVAIDAIGDHDPDAHHNSVTRIFPRLAETGTTGDILALLKAD